MSFVENCKGPQRCRWERRLWTTNRTPYAFDQRTEMALKNSAFAIGMVTWALLTACNGDSDGTTVQDTGSVEDTSTTMDGGTENDGTTAQDIGSAEDTSTTMDAGAESDGAIAQDIGSTEDGSTTMDGGLSASVFSPHLWDWTAVSPVSFSDVDCPVARMECRLCLIGESLPALLDPSVFVVHRASGQKVRLAAPRWPADEAEGVGQSFSLGVCKR